MTVRILVGDCRRVLRELAAESVHCAVTSPPYWGLRDYQIEPTVWGGDEACEHDFECETVEREIRTGAGLAELGKRYRGGGTKQGEIPVVRAERGVCSRCGAWRGSFGLEPDYKLYVEHAVEVFREVRRVLRSDGTLWLNLGDSYASAPGAQQRGAAPSDSSTLRGNGHLGGGPKLRSLPPIAWSGRSAPGATSRAGRSRGTHDASNSGKQAYVYVGSNRAQRGDGNGGIPFGPLEQPNRMPQPGLKPKDLCGIPWRVALALQDDGWWLRQDIIWAKPNPMPESVEDRCTKAHEYLFLLAKSENYFYDAEAIKEAVSENTHARRSGIGRKNAAIEFGGGIKHNNDFAGAINGFVSSRNKRSVWTVATQPFPEAHFATFPPALVEPCVAAATSERGCCVKCGAGWARVVAPTARYAELLGQSYHDHGDDAGAGMMQHRGVNRQNAMVEAGITGKETETIGWHPTCRCDGLERLPPYPPAPKDKSDAAVAAWRRDCAIVTEKRRALCAIAAPLTTSPAVVLDPFGGAGTTALVADRRGRDAVLVELNPDYAEMARRRLSDDGGMFARVAAE